MNILGISAYYHDSSAALIVEDKVVAAAQEERFSRKKHDSSFPIEACRYCLSEAGFGLADLDAIVFYEKPFLKFERILLSQISSFPKGLPMFLRVMPIWLKEKLNMRHTIKKELEKAFRERVKKICFAEHHLSHAALAFCCSGFDEADILVVDAVGEWATTSVMRGSNKGIEVISEQRYPDSIGFLYSAVTQFLGFTVNSDEYKVMGLAPYGEPNTETKYFIKLIKDELVKTDASGTIQLNLAYFSFQYGDKMIRCKKWESLFGFKQREPYSELNEKHKNLALAFQSVTEDIIVSLAKGRKTLNNLCLCGGVALNCSANGKLLKSGVYRNIYVPFAPGDCGCSLGAALAYKILHSGKRTTNISPYLGPKFTSSEIERTIMDTGLSYEAAKSDEELCEYSARLLIKGNIIGWFQGRMELGPRALGNRSILADARNPRMKDLVNSRIKFREGFRPFAPSVLEEYAPTIFSCEGKSPYMMFTYDVLSDNIPAVTHVDFSARIQTVSYEDNPLYYKLLKSFHSLTGCPVVLNTSFNVMGDPIVCSPKDAIDTFLHSGLDYLVIGKFIIKKISYAISQRAI